MTFNVQLHKSGKTFSVNGHDTLLDSALKTGIPLPYGCSNGNCGECEARIVSGEVERVRHHDFVIPQARKLAGHTLLCSYAPLCDLVLDANEAASENEIPPQEITAKIKSINCIKDAVAVVRAQTPRSQRLRYLAGQQVLAEFNDVQRTLPLASCPCEDRMLEFHVDLNNPELFSTSFYSGKTTPKQIKITGPQPGFKFSSKNENILIFIAYKTGFAAIKSLIEHCINIEYADTMRFIWLHNNDQQPYLHGLARSWADSLDNFSYSAYDLNDAGNAQLDAVLKADAEVDLRVFACGLENELEPLKPLWSQAGRADDRLQCLVLT